ncbi:MAG: ABC transporter ATP-binding protein [Rhizobiaceae bacterium]|nr:ABC transporter ATP-binding protein [Rhizobiaceae bacterium]
MLEVRNLFVRYGQHRALEDLSIHVAPGEIVVILGANGAGKSTLLKAIGGNCEGQVEGSIEMDGQPILGLPSHKIVETGIALVPEGRGIFADLSVYDNLMLGAYPKRARDVKEENLERIHELFPKLIERRHQIVRTMSGGEQQMVAIGRAMMSAPNILMLDEPSLGLSPLLCKELFRNLSEVRKTGLGILLVEQNAKQSLAIADRGYLLENAKIMHEDKAASLASDPMVQKAYLGAGAASSSKPASKVSSKPETNPSDIAAAALESFAPKEASFAVPPSIYIPSKNAPTRSADELLGQSVTDLVARATSQAGEPTNIDVPIAQNHNDRLKSVLAEIEAAAASARGRPARTKRRSSYRNKE